LPKGKWKFYQEWNNAVFLHWQADYNELRKLVPKHLEIDLYDSKPWVSLVAFTMEKVRPRHLPAFKPVSYFHEVNIRTYVKDGEKTGVYFLSIEGSKKLACKVALAMSELPYRFSKMKRGEGYFVSHNANLNDSFNLKYNIKETVKEMDSLDKWLTERYALFQDSGDVINQYEIHHVEWPVQEIEIKDLQVSYLRFGKLLSGKPLRQHYSKGVQVVAWQKVKMKKDSKIDKIEI
jgi:uncharacterized protein YqjF (DUF2071 family)